MQASSLELSTINYYYYLLSYRVDNPMDSDLILMDFCLVDALLVPENPLSLAARVPQATTVM